MTKNYDVVIIGGGIHGVGVAQAAAAQGYRTMLLEQNQLASGTSSRSSKLIHGGLRYLESAQFSLVNECLNERRILLRIAPNIVKLQRFYIPIYKDTQRRPWQIFFGLSLYALLNKLKRSGYFHRLEKKSWAGLDGITSKNLQAVFCYYDAQTDDAELTHAVMASAQQLGAELIMPASFSSAEITDKNCIVNYRYKDTEISCKTRVLVNATGPWINHALKKISPTQKPQAINLVQGTHIIVTGKPNKGCYYMEAPDDKRAVFAMPWKGDTLIGTTETLFSENDPAQAHPIDFEIDYLWRTLCHYFPAYEGQRHKLISSFSGLRVLPADDTRNFNKPRETILLTDRKHQPRLLSIYGGKLTAYRATAEDVMKRLETSLPKKKYTGNTQQISL